MPKFMIKDCQIDEGIPPQVCAEFRADETQAEQEWTDWLRDHGCQFPPAWRNTDGTRDYFCWILDPNVFFAYKMKFA